ncbi:hypothetical protein [Cupriavidus lacunae]|uniref:hypothetical protein n=1 Tax=Cupriavidus lacunae TaxID=2666307 RepID=UPI001374E642|nr:hypothetical protein [Cupriavidus lacunae]
MRTGPGSHRWITAADRLAPVLASICSQMASMARTLGKAFTPARVGSQSGLEE